MGVFVKPWMNVAFGSDYTYLCYFTLALRSDPFKSLTFQEDYEGRSGADFARHIPKEHFRLNLKGHREVSQTSLLAAALSVDQPTCT